MKSKYSAHPSVRLSPLAAKLLGGLFVVALAAPLAAQAAEDAMRVVRDAETGQLRPATADEIAAMDAAAAKANAASMAGGKRVRRADVTAAPVTTPELLPNGITRMEVGEDSLVYSVATRAADGSIETHCVQGDKAANKLVQSKARRTSSAAKNQEHAHELR